MTSIIPSPWPVVHIHRYFGTVEDDHGNLPRVEDPPVVRMAMSILQTTGLEVFTADSSLRVSTAIDMVVADPPTYCADDHVMLWPQLDAAGEWVVGTGTLYWVDGDPTDERVGPWPALLKVFGGTVKLKRVT